MYSGEQQALLDRGGAPPYHMSRSPDGGSAHRLPTYHDHDDDDDDDDDNSHASRLDGGAERTSFLPGTGSTSTSDADEDDYLARARRPSRSPTVFQVTIAASLLILVIDVVASVPMAPRMVIFERIICRNHYAAWQDGGSEDCKIEPVQSELAMINGWKETFDTIPGLLVSIPYGALANRIGRGKVLILALLGCLFSDTWVAIVCLLPQTFPIRTIWLSGLFQLIGGGGATVISMCYTVIGDLCSPNQRTTAFSQVHGAILLSELVSIPLGSALIAVNPWIPVLSALGLMAVTTTLTFLLTINFDHAYMTKRLPESDDIPPSLPPASPLGKTPRRFSRFLKELRSVGPWITRDVLLVIAAFFFCQLSRQFSSVLLQYSAFKFNWDYAKASFLIPLRAGINLLVLIVLIPRLSRFFVTSRRLSQSQADKSITILSGICLVIGSLLIFVAVHPSTMIVGQIFIAAGFAFTVTARSFITTMVDARYLSLLYTSITSVTYGGLIVGGPLLAGLFQWGLHLGDGWIGMPFLVTAILFGTATLAVTAARGGS